MSVADLVNRNAPAPEATATDNVGGVSVGSLLRREGRAPHSLDRPVQPRPHQQGDQAAAARRTTVRRTAIAAGSLLAAGSVLGPIAFGAATPAPVGAGASADIPYPGQGRLDQNGQQPAPPAGTALDPVLGSGALDRPGTLDPGVPAPNSWAAIAFPGNVGPSVGGSAVVAGVQSGSLAPQGAGTANLAATAGAQLAAADPVDGGTGVPAAGGTLGESVRDTANEVLGFADRGAADTPPPAEAPPQAERPATPPVASPPPETIPVLAPEPPRTGGPPPTGEVPDPVDVPPVALPAASPTPPDETEVEGPAAPPAEPVSAPVLGGEEPVPAGEPSRTPVVVQPVREAPVTVVIPAGPVVVDTETEEAVLLVASSGTDTDGTDTTGSEEPASEDEEPAGTTDGETPEDATTVTGTAGDEQTDTDPAGGESSGDTSTAAAITFELEPASSTGPVVDAEPTTSISVGRVIAEMLGG